MRVPGEKNQEPSIDALGGGGLDNNSEQDIPVPNQHDLNMQGASVKPQNNENPFGKEKFDAGIDVDEEQDPKKFIERLTGKLAQKLRSYNETDKDSDLNKFVINSLIPAAVPNLEDDDVNDVIKKVEDNKGGSNEEQPLQSDDNDEKQPTIDNEPEQKEPQVTQESINELINEILSGKKLSRNIKNKNPFQPKKFKK